MLLSAVPILASLDEKKTIKFYKEKLGFTFHSSWDGYLIFSRDGVIIHLWPCDNAEVSKNTSCYINVNEMDRLYGEYKAKGIIHPDGDMKEMPWKAKQFSVLDNNGNLIRFGEQMTGNR